MTVRSTLKKCNHEGMTNFEGANLSGYLLCLFLKTQQNQRS